MLDLIIQAILLGLTLSVLIGPVFFELIQVSIQRGFKAGAAFAIGIVISDLSCIFLAYLGVSHFVSDPFILFLIGLIGGIIMISFGLFGLVQKTVIAGRETDSMAVKPKIVANFFKAFFLNIATPFVFLFWLGVTGIVTAKYGASTPDVVLFFSIMLATIFTIDITKAYAALKLKKLLTTRTLLIIRRIAAVILILFGIVLILRVIYLQ